MLSVVKVILIHGSMRAESNTKLVARWIIEKYRRCCQIEEWNLHKEKIPLFEDKRHSNPSKWYLPKSMQVILKGIYGANVIVITTPLYWYGMSALMKNFFDWFAHPLYRDRARFKSFLAGKKLILVVTGSESGFRPYEALILQIKKIAVYLGLNYGGVHIVVANRYSELIHDAKAKKAAERFKL